MNSVKTHERHNSETLRRKPDREGGVLVVGNRRTNRNCLNVQPDTIQVARFSVRRRSGEWRIWELHCRRNENEHKRWGGEG